MLRLALIIGILMFLPACKAKSLISKTGTADSQDKQLILVLFDKYIAAVKTGDRDLMTSVFHPTAMMYGYYKQFDNNMPIADFIDIQMRKGSAPDVVTQIHNLEITGRIATLKVVSENWNGDSYTDYYTCIKTVKGAVGTKKNKYFNGDKEEWLIASKTFTYIKRDSIRLKSTDNLK
jgi:hypothetical protein